MFILRGTIYFTKEWLHILLSILITPLMCAAVKCSILPLKASGKVKNALISLAGNKIICMAHVCTKPNILPSTAINCHRVLQLQLSSPLLGETVTW